MRVAKRLCLATRGPPRGVRVRAAEAGGGDGGRVGRAGAAGVRARDGEGAGWAAVAVELHAPPAAGWGREPAVHVPGEGGSGAAAAGGWAVLGAGAVCGEEAAGGIGFILTTRHSVCVCV